MNVKIIKAEYEIFCVRGSCPDKQNCTFAITLNTYHSLCSSSFKIRHFITVYRKAAVDDCLYASELRRQWRIETLHAHHLVFLMSIPSRLEHEHVLQRYVPARMLSVSVLTEKVHSEQLGQYVDPSWCRQVWWEPLDRNAGPQVSTCLGHWQGCLDRQYWSRPVGRRCRGRTAACITSANSRH